jgi:hypothetical protein
MFIIDEAKSVPDTIFAAADRCSRQYELICSNPGLALGRFFECFNSLSRLYWSRKVTSFQCPHIDPAGRARDLALVGGDESNSWFRSKHLAEFTAELAGDPIIAAKRLAEVVQNPPTFVQGTRCAFCDFAAVAMKTSLRYAKVTVSALLPPGANAIPTRPGGSSSTSSSVCSLGPTRSMVTRAAWA